LKKLAKAFSVSTDWLLFEDAERGPDEDLRLQFEAMSQLTPEEKSVARAVLEGLILKHAAHQWAGPQTRSAAPGVVTHAATKAARPAPSAQAKPAKRSVPATKTSRAAK
jgi:hypothetical protein